MVLTLTTLSLIKFLRSIMYGIAVVSTIMELFYNNSSSSSCVVRRRRREE